MLGDLITNLLAVYPMLILTVEHYVQVHRIQIRTERNGPFPFQEHASLNECNRLIASVDINRPVPRDPSIAQVTVPHLQCHNFPQA
jgi:hypothetical protein